MYMLLRCYVVTLLIMIAWWVISIDISVLRQLSDCHVSVTAKDSMLLETQNAASLEKLRQLEGRAFTRTEIEETVVTEKPR